MQRDVQRELVNRFFSGTGVTYDRMARAGTFGADLWWKRKILEAVPADPARIVDQAAGTGILTFQLARRFPRCQVVGVELRREYLEVARAKNRGLRIPNASFVQGRAEEVVFAPGVDAVTSSYLAKYAELDPLIANARKMLRPGGVLVLHDFTYPRVRFYARVWELHLRLLGTVGSRWEPAWRDALEGLPELVRTTTWVAEAGARLRAKGFVEIQDRRLTFGSAALVTAVKGA